MVDTLINFSSNVRAQGRWPRGAGFAHFSSPGGARALRFSWRPPTPPSSGPPPGTRRPAFDEKRSIFDTT
jgi:hypothetical protein